MIVGNVLSSGLRQNVARQVAIHAGLPQEVSCLSINKVCGSGLRAISLAAQVIKAGDAEVVRAQERDRSRCPIDVVPGRGGHPEPPAPAHALASRPRKALDALAHEASIMWVPSREHELRALQIRHRNQKSVQVRHQGKIVAQAETSGMAKRFGD